jgi:hypothetical protein
MKFERVLQDGNGQSFRVVLEIDEDGPKLEAALRRLANKARSSMTHRTVGHATAMDGAVRVEVTQVSRAFVYQCAVCRTRLTYDSQLPEHRLNHRRQTSGPCEGLLVLVEGGIEA